MKHCHRLLLLLFGLYLILFVRSSGSLYSQIPSILIVSVRFEGNRIIDAQQMKQLLKGSIEGYPYSAENLKNDLKYVETWYQDEGFLQAKAGPADILPQIIGGTKGIAIRIPVIEGPRYVLGKVEVRNTQALAPNAIMQLCPLRKGQPYSRSKIVQWQTKIEETYSSEGYVRARCNARETHREADASVDCSLECTEGKQYRVGKISIVADPSIDRLQFKRRLLFSEGGVFNREMLSTSIYYINAKHLYKPISNSDVEIAIDDSRGVIDLTWHLFPQ
jgi:outer membrane protein insertion porin family